MARSRRSWPRHAESGLRPDACAIGPGSFQRPEQIGPIALPQRGMDGGRLPTPTDAEVGLFPREPARAVRRRNPRRHRPGSLLPCAPPPPPADAPPRRSRMPPRARLPSTRASAIGIRVVCAVAARHGSPLAVTARRARRDVRLRAHLDLVTAVRTAVSSRRDVTSGWNRISHQNPFPGLQNSLTPYLGSEARKRCLRR